MMDVINVIEEGGISFFANTRIEQLCTIVYIVDNSSSKIYMACMCHLLVRWTEWTNSFDFGTRPLLYHYALIKNRYRESIYFPLKTKLQFFFLIFYTLWRYYSKIIFRVEHRLDLWIYRSLVEKVESRL